MINRIKDMLMKKLSIIFLFVALTACHSKKNIASSASADASTIATTDIRVSTSKLDSAFSSMAIKLDSFVVTAEPVLIAPCPDSVANRSAVITYRYHIKAKSASVKGEKNAVSRAYTDTLQQDSVAVLLSSSLSDSQEITPLYNHMSIVKMLLILVLVFFLVICLRTKI